MTKSETNLPENFLNKIKEAFPKDFENILAGYKNKEKKVTFRINNLKGNKDSVLNELKNAGLEIKELDFLPNAFYYEGTEKEIWETTPYKNGEIYLQSSSSQIPALILNPQNGDKVLDMTAAPGGKTSQIADLMKNSGSIVACERNLIRYNKMIHNLEKLGVTNAEFLKIDSTKLSEKFEDETFDKILIDAPCSGEGRFDLNNEKTYSHRNSDFVKKISNIQKFLLKASHPLLKKGGTLVYSTCTLSPEENEAQIHMMLSCFKDLALEEITLEIPNKKDGLKKAGDKVFRKELNKTARIMPSESSEGFFVAKFKKV